MPHGALLIAFADAVTRGQPDFVSEQRRLVAEALGAEAAVDACAVIANFEMMVRIADGTGIPLDPPMAVFGVETRAELGIDRYAAAASTRPPGAFVRALLRVVDPLVPRTFNLLGALRRRLSPRR